MFLKNKRRQHTFPNNKVRINYNWKPKSFVKNLFLLIEELYTFCNSYCQLNISVCAVQYATENYFWCLRREHLLSFSHWKICLYLYLSQGWILKQWSNYTSLFLLDCFLTASSTGHPSTKLLIYLRESIWKYMNLINWSTINRLPQNWQLWTTNSHFWEWITSSKYYDWFFFMRKMLYKFSQAFGEKVRNMSPTSVRWSEKMHHCTTQDSLLARKNSPSSVSAY